MLSTGILIILIILSNYDCGSIILNGHPSHDALASSRECLHRFDRLLHYYNCIFTLSRMCLSCDSLSWEETLNKWIDSRACIFYDISAHVQTHTCSRWRGGGRCCGCCLAQWVPVLVYLLHFSLQMKVLSLIQWCTCNEIVKYVEIAFTRRHSHNPVPFQLIIECTVSSCSISRWVGGCVINYIDFIFNICSYPSQW